MGVSAPGKPHQWASNFLRNQGQQWPGNRSSPGAGGIGGLSGHLPNPGVPSSPSASPGTVESEGAGGIKHLSTHHFAMGPEMQRSQLTHMRSPRSGWLSWGVGTQAGLQCPIPALLPQSAAQSLPAQSGANWSGGARLWIYKRSGQAWQPHAWGGGQLPASVSASTRAMAPGSIASSDTSTSSASLTSAVGSSGLSESEKPGRQREVGSS